MKTWLSSKEFRELSDWKTGDRQMGYRAEKISGLLSGIESMGMM